jgi:1-acyl-sn-glycerol-3-phosphate acyltransferase
MLISVFFTVMLLFFGILIMVLGTPLVFVCWLLDRSGRIDHYLIKWYLCTLSRIGGMRMTIEGRENYRRSEQYLILCNHKSSADIFPAAQALRLHFKFFAASYLFSIPLFGWCIRMAGYLPIDRSNKRQARESIIKGTGILKQGKASLLIFPEGTRTEASEIKDFKFGFLRIATEARKPILPVVMDGTVDIKRKNSFWFHSGHIYVSVLPPISTEDITEDRWSELKKKYEDLYRTEYARIHSLLGTDLGPKP